MAKASLFNLAVLFLSTKYGIVFKIPHIQAIIETVMNGLFPITNFWGDTYFIVKGGIFDFI